MATSDEIVRSARKVKVRDFVVRKWLSEEGDDNFDDNLADIFEDVEKKMRERDQHEAYVLVKIYRDKPEDDQP